MTTTDPKGETMTEQQTEQATTEESTEVAQTPPDVEEQEGQEGEQEGGKPNREAARYRTQLRDAQSQLEQTSASLTAMQRAEVIRLAGENLADGTDLFLHRGDDISAYLNEDGTVNADAVKAAVGELTQERSYLTGKRFQGTHDGGPTGVGGVHFGGGSSRRPPPRMGAIFDQKTS